MVNIVMGPEGSGKTKLLIDAISRALKTESGSMVCIEKGHTLRYDVDHRVRLIDASEYSIKSYTLLQGFISGLHAGNFDITHIFIDNLYNLFALEGPRGDGELPRLVQPVLGGKRRGVYVYALPTTPSNPPEYIARYGG